MMFRSDCIKDDLVSLEVASEMLNNGRASGVHSAAWIGEVL